MLSSLSKKQKKGLQFAVKLLLTSAALFFVFTKIDIGDLWLNVKKTNIWLFISAFLAFNLSKSIASLRQNRFYAACNVMLNDFMNWRLYYLGMFYNVFLPGSIGGDAYKVYLLKQNNKETKLRHLTSATLLDRLSGLVLLLILASTMLMLSSWTWPEQGANLFERLPLVTIILGLPVFYFVIKLLFPLFLNAFASTTLLSLGVQIGQVLCAFLLLLSLDAQGNHWDYLTLFMLSSVAAVIPITISGVGLREVVFLWGYSILNIQKDQAIAFTLLFFVITALSSLMGFFISYGLKLPKNEELSLSEESTNKELKD